MLAEHSRVGGLYLRLRRIPEHGEVNSFLLLSVLFSFLSFLFFNRFKKVFNIKLFDGFVFSGDLADVADVDTFEEDLVRDVEGVVLDSIADFVS